MRGRDGWRGGKGKEGKEYGWEGRGYPYRSGSELEYPILKRVAGLS